MRKPFVILVFVFCIDLLFCACGQASEKTQPEETTETEQLEELSEEEQLFGKYEDIIRALESGDYDGAVSTIEQLKTEANIRQYGDINDYLVTVELTPENFDEYFEFVTTPTFNDFGEQNDYLKLGLRSKKYDEGLILYGVDDLQYCDTFAIEYTADYSYEDYSDTDTTQWRLASFLSFSTLGGSNIKVTSIRIDRIAGSKLTFIKKE